MGNTLGITAFGAFTQDTANKIAQAIGQVGTNGVGKTFYLDPANGLDQYNGQSPTVQGGGVGPVKTLAAGYALLTSGNNDTLVLIGNGSTTATARLTATFTWAKSATNMIGICSGSRFSQRARIAPTTTVAAFTPLFTLSGNGCYFGNIEFFDGFATGTTAQIGLNVTGSRNTFYNCQISGMGDAASAADAGSRTMVIATDENYFSHCVIGLDTISRGALNATVELKSGAARNVFEDCIFPVLVSTAAAGLVVLTAAAAAIDRYTMFRRCLFTNAAAFSGGAAATGVVKMLAAAGGAIYLNQCSEYGFTDWGYDAASKLQILVDTAGTTSASSIAIVNT